MTMPRQKTRFALDVAKSMPPLRHKLGEVFDVNTSEVIAWLVRQPKVRQYLFQTCSGNDLIVFDAVSRTWRGKDYKPAAPAEGYRF
jgi:hypothetical protein